MGGYGDIVVIGGVRFQKKEVLGTSTKMFGNAGTNYTVKTKHGTYVFSESNKKNSNGVEPSVFLDSMRNVRINNCSLYGIFGTKEPDTYILEDSDVTGDGFNGGVHIGNDNTGDKVYLTGDSTVQRAYVDNQDEIVDLTGKPDLRIK